MFKIIKKTSVVWWHEFNGTVRHISNFVAVADINNQTFFIRSISGAYFPLEAVNISNIIVIDETASGTEETFSTITDLINRLVALQYTPYNSSGGGSGVTQFVQLTDVPNSYTGQAGKVATVKTDETGLEFTDPASGAVGDLQQVTDNGATTTNPLTITDASITLDNTADDTVIILEGSDGTVTVIDPTIGDNSAMSKYAVSVTGGDAQISIDKDKITRTKGVFNTDVTFEEPTQINEIIVPNENGTLATREWVEANPSGGAVDSVNGQIGVVVLDADDISDSGTTNKFVTASEKTAITHSNRSVLDAITEAFTTALKTAYDSAVTWISTNGTNVLNHIASTSNPHNVTKSQVGLSNVPNTDATNPANISQSASYRFVTDTEKSTWNGKESAITVGTTSQYYRGDKTFQTLDKTAVGLGNVDNTSDVNKPISTATQTALNGKISLNAIHDISLTSTIVGWSSFTTRYIGVLDLGNAFLCIIDLRGVSNSATTSITVPFTNTGGTAQQQMRVENSGTFQTTPGLASIANGANTISFFLNNQGASFTNSGNKSIVGQILIYK